MFEGLLQWFEAHEKLAAWIQAIFSVVAIFSASVLAIWQARTQFLHGQKLQRHEWSFQRTESAKTLSAIADICSRLVMKIEDSITSYIDFCEAAAGLISGDIDELVYLEKVIGEYPVHSLPDLCAKEALILHAELRDLRKFLDENLRLDANVDHDNFHEWFMPNLLALIGEIVRSALAIKVVIETIEGGDELEE